MFQPLDETLGRGRGHPVAIGGGKDQQALRRPVACGIEGGHGRHMDGLPSLAQRAVQRGGKAPGAAGLGADEDDSLGPACRSVSADARACPPACQPEGKPAHCQCRHRKRHQTQDETDDRRAAPGMQHREGIRDPRQCRSIGPGQKLARALIEIASAPVGLQREGVGGIGRVGKAQIAQRGHRQIGKRRDMVGGDPGLAAGRGRKERRPRLIRQQSEGRGRHPQRGQRGKRQTRHRYTRQFDMQPCRRPPARGAEPAAPAAHAPRNQSRPRGAQQQHDPRTRRHDQSARIAREQLPMQVDQPAFDRVGIGRRYALPGRRVDHRRPGRAILEPPGRDAS